MTEGWKYYNHAVVPTCAPHEQQDTESLEKGLVWSNTGGYSTTYEMDDRLGL